MDPILTLTYFWPLILWSHYFVIGFFIRNIEVTSRSKMKKYFLHNFILNQSNLIIALVSFLISSLK